ncbi:hypothetical protein AVEN_185386-1 [Araneus ventricosus]|uniref:Uncharacterized protein n=1 Tax=Araneus ventricosus TaxID=182803 RepID=A0A4Y2CHR3_ARAVE|nr:hypothetical protein AVEN_185386-1 [Araneus ventricosus]
MLRNQISSCCCAGLVMWKDAFKMQRSAVCVSTWAICCRGKVKAFQMRGKLSVSCEKQDFFSFPVAWLNRDSWQDVKCGPPRIFIFPV